MKRTSEQIADGSAYVCEHLEPISATLTAATGGTVPLDAVLAALREGRDPAEALETLHRALRAARDALGVFGRLRAVPPRVPAGTDTTARRERVLLCPRTVYVCSRYAWPEPDSDPLCAISGQPLRRTWLEP